MEATAMPVTNLIWLATLAGIAGLVVLDFLVAARKPHEVGFREAASWSVFYIGVAVSFGFWVWMKFGSGLGTEYFAAYLVEKSLSVDNLFVFVIILAQFAVPAIYHQRVLLVGVVLALGLRAIFIAVGAKALDSFAFTFVIFGAILVWTGFGLFRHWNEDPELSDNKAVKAFRKATPVADDFHGTKLFVRLDGVRHATPMLLVMVAIASTDLLFALDSIPATFGVTQEPYLVFSANAFALLGLRALYFLLKELLDKLVYLSLGLSFILMFIGFKLILIYLHGLNAKFPHIGTPASLLVIAAILLVTTVASLRKSKQDQS
jgi:tellurite resistance protein TerC